MVGKLEHWGLIFSHGGVYHSDLKEGLQENCLESLTCIPEVCEEQRLEKYRDGRVWLACSVQQLRSLG